MTSYFAKAAKDPDAVSIALYSPSWYKGREYKKLAPEARLLKKYKQDKDVSFYIQYYQKSVLDKLDPKQVFDELGKKAILLCWEKSAEFCHRHLVSWWFEKNLRIKVKELNSDKEYQLDGLNLCTATFLNKHIELPHV